MSDDQNPYDKLGLSEDASFDEIQDVRNRLLEQHSGDVKRLEAIEAAYDAILMERLKMRQEGKIKVPERIRFPERLVQSLPKESQTPRQHSPAWLQRILDKPTLTDTLLPGAWFVGLSAISIFYQPGSEQVLQFTLVLGVCISIYFINRKEKKFARAVLLTLVGLTTGLLAGGLFATWLISQVQIMNVNQFSTIVTFVLLWLISSFLR
ncbi:CPP1-like family protein [Brasilonema sp. CT11]|nr:CPP1-like family protein [Brasilonema sp. CT11]